MFARPLHRLVIQLVLLLLGATPLLAQRIRWEPPGGSLAIRQTSQLSLIFEDCEPEGEFTLPPIPHLTLGTANRGEQSSVNITNGQVNRTRTIYYSYPVRPTEQATVRIPAFTITTDKGPIRVPAATFEVGEATVGGSSVPLDTAANSKVITGSGPLWAGEVVPVEYVLSVANRFPANLASGPEWEPAPLVLEEWSKPEPGTALVNGENRNTVTYRSRGYIRQPGNHALPAISQLINLRVPGSGFSIFQAFQAEQYTITSNPLQLVVRPLPAPAPPGFHGAVGTFQLASKVVPENAVVGEPVTWTLALTGTGNWPDIQGLPPREVSRDFRVVQPQAQRVMTEGQLFEGSLTEDVVLIPTRPGTYRLGPLVWSYFDPSSGRYQTVQSAPITLTVASGAVPSSSGEPAPAEGRSSADEDGPAPRPTPAPGAPDPIPRDPLPLAGAVSSPCPAAHVAWFSLGILLIAPLAWLSLAVRRAFLTDPGRPAREARRRLIQTVGELRTAAPSRQRMLLAQWQQDVILLFGLRHAAPDAATFADPAWQQLWQESEQGLYAAAPGLPSDWVTRAVQALSSRPAPAFRAATALHARNLLPVWVVGLFLIVPEALPAQTAEEAYARGDFPAAEAQWRRVLAEAPTHWSAHHNLSLALAQQERWGEAAAHATAAFIQQPNHASVRWHYSYTLARAGYTPAHLARFVTGGNTLDHVAAHFSPSAWQRLLLSAVGVLLFAILLLLLRNYGYLPRWTAWVSVGLTLAAVAAGLCAFSSISRYGVAAQANAVLVWRQTTLRSLPTDVPTEQQTSTLAPGSVAVVDQAFLGWRRLRFTNGQTGWVRSAEFVPLWDAR